MSNLESLTFYKEANDMQQGWGDYLLKIDQLKDKLDNKEDITLKEACWVMWADKFVQSRDYLAFQKFIKTIRLQKRKLTFQIWWSLYKGWKNE